ncbi:MAG TPA: hypothetical protein VGQ35_12620, partial [Dongiaceae bacterium]|nr:hypothetical protein [Dongiaceae bacterium]
PCCWKPVLIRETMEASQGAVLWMDAGNLVHERLERVRGVLATTGFYSPTSSGDVERFTHPQVLALLDARPEILKDANRNGAIIGFGRNEVGLELSRIWRDCALREEIMHPSDWTKDSWRSDQAILSVLVAQFRRRYGFMLKDGLLGISYHNDSLSSREARLYMKRAPMRNGAPEIKQQLTQQHQRPVRRLGRLAKRSWRKLRAAFLRG